MQIDIRGKINEKKLAFSNTLLPLYEAIVNSIQAIEEGSSTEIGIIEIDIVRSSQQTLDSSILPSITDFHIKDNGVGFNSKNYESFNFAHSTYKFKKGGKGIGRFTWLRAFAKAEIESKFYENETWNLRTFNFEPTKLGIEKHQLGKVNGPAERYTIVRLKGLKEDYKKWCNNSAEGIALKIIEHCFIYFLNKNCPRVLINDFENQIVVNDLFICLQKAKSKHENLKLERVYLH